MDFNGSIQGHELVSVERYQDSTRHMIEFDVLSENSAVGFKGKRLRLFLSNEGYRNALTSEKQKKIAIRRHANVIEGNIIYDRKKRKRKR